MLYSGRKIGWEREEPQKLQMRRAGNISQRRRGLSTALRDGWNSKGLVAGLSIGWTSRRAPPWWLSANVLGLEWFRLALTLPGLCVFCLGRWETFFKNVRPRANYSFMIFPSGCLYAEADKGAKTLTRLSSPGEKVAYRHTSFIHQKPYKGWVTIPVLQMSKLEV